MKKINYMILTVLMVLGGTNLFAQGRFGADSANCVKYLSYYQEYYKQKNYNDALPNWRKAMQLCPPTASQNMLLNGQTLFRRLISQSKNADERKSLIDSLFLLNDLRAANYPKYSVAALNNKGVDMTNYIKDDNQRLFSSLNEIIEANKEQTKPSLLLFNMNSAIALFQDGKIDAGEVINTYDRNMALLDKAPADKPEDAEEVGKMRASIEDLFISSKVASCENLIALFTPRFNANPNDLDLVTNIAKMLNTAEGCTDNELYLNAVNTMYKLNPSGTSAYYLYRLYDARNNREEATKYLEAAIASDDIDPKNRAQYEYELAVLSVKAGNNAKAYASAQKALDMDPSLAGKCYMIMGNIWGSVVCGGNEIEKRAHFWVAVDYMQKAKAADASLTSEANKYISSYAVYYPQTADAFMYDVTDGQSYTVSCGGMRATTTVRTQK